jgi:IS30 family transposase
MDDELILRKQAVDLFLKGNAKKDIAQTLGKSRQWVHKWIKRYHTIGGDTWYHSCSTAPKTITKKTPTDLEKLIISIRKGLDGKLYSQKGALNVLYELKRLGVAPPSIATINRILKRNGLISKDSLKFAKKKSTQVILL